MAHAMFALPVIDASLKTRTGGAQWFAETVAAFGLIATILAGIRFQRTAVPSLVGLYITAAYWFTASTSFANPAVAIARSMTNTFSGIRPADLPGFIVAELCGAIVALNFMNWLLRRPGKAVKHRGNIAMTVTIYHNPACGTSRNTLAMIRQSGEEPDRDRVSQDAAGPREAERVDRSNGDPATGLIAKRARPMRNSAWPTPRGATRS